MPTFLMVGKVTQRTVNFDADNQLVSVCPTFPPALLAELAVAIKHVTNEGRQESSHPRTPLCARIISQRALLTPRTERQLRRSMVKHPRTSYPLYH